MWVQPYTVTLAKLAPDLGSQGHLRRMRIHNVIVEADFHLSLLQTSILDIYKVFAPLVCCLKGVWVHPYTVTPTKLAPPQIWGVT